jgi:hypothetical protein
VKVKVVGSTKALNGEGPVSIGFRNRNADYSIKTFTSSRDGYKPFD